jgi:23S rRNA (adenine2030-N6)-methyltransferase
LLSYRHAFHAGNFADVLKHLVLHEVLVYLTRKDKPLCYIDSHAGAGLYGLRDAHAQKNREFDNGIGLLWARDDLPPSVAAYRQCIGGFNPHGELRHYPGSPLVAARLLRDHDRLFLFELHGSDFRLLGKHLHDDRRVHLFDTDGFAGVVANVPPRERRGLVLIDPPYEVKRDYVTVVDTLVDAHRRFATGVYAVWYPVVERARIQDMVKKLTRSGIRRIQQFELGIRDDRMPGMGSAGMLLVNPPWSLLAGMREALPYLAALLGGQGNGNGSGHWLAEELVGE